MPETHFLVQKNELGLFYENNEKGSFQALEALVLYPLFAPFCWPLGRAEPGGCRDWNGASCRLCSYCANVRAT